jgi:tryptophan synthase beta subunit
MQRWCVGCRAASASPGFTGSGVTYASIGAHAMKLAPTMGKDQIVIVNLSGRGDKDVHTVAKMMGMEI